MASQSKLTAANLSSKVDGSMLGNNLSATGSNNSMNGTMTNTANGMSRRMSVVVRLSCRRSRLVKDSPCSNFHWSLDAILTSFARSFEPFQ